MEQVRRKLKNLQRKKETKTDQMIQLSRDSDQIEGTSTQIKELMKNCNIVSTKLRNELNTRIDEKTKSTKQLPEEKSAALSMNSQHYRAIDEAERNLEEMDKVELT